MTEIEKQALALVHEVEAERGYRDRSKSIDRTHPEMEVMCRAIERLAAFKQEVSAGIESVKNWPGQPMHFLDRFIIAKPDPLDAIFGEIGLEANKFSAGDFRAALAARGLKIVEADNAF